MTNWRGVWAVFAGGLVAAAHITKVSPALPALREQLGLTLVQSGLIATMFNVMGMTVGMLAGVLCDRLGHKRLALFGLSVMVAGGGLGAAAAGFRVLLLSRFLEGVGFIVYVVSAPALITAAAGASAHERSRALALWSSYMPTGGTVALLVAPALIAAWGWRGLWGGIALATALTALVFWRVVPAAPYGAIRSLRLVVESLAQKGNLAMAALFAFYVAQWNSVMVWLPTFLVEEHGASTRTAAIATALMVLANAPGTLAGGWLLSRGMRRSTLIVCGALLGAACELGMFSDALPSTLRFGSVLAFSFCTGVIPASIFAGLPIHARTPQHISTGNGIINQASQAGQFFGPLFLAWLASRLGWQASLWAMLMFACGGGLCGLVIGAIENRRHRASSSV
ncbi:MAG TPA: MFS transporter [Burkholderiales bacterium]|nr:MFS transporter [Burkholderiales bacterium]